jgi:hypothetical protein
VKAGFLCGEALLSGPREQVHGEKVMPPAPSAQLQASQEPHDLQRLPRASARRLQAALAERLRNCPRRWSAGPPSGAGTEAGASNATTLHGSRNSMRN